MKKLLNNIIIRRISDLLLSPITFFSALWFKYIRTATIRQMPISERIFMQIGVLPVKDHYYQPLINPRKYLKRPLEDIRTLPGIDWNIPEQLALLSKFNYTVELEQIPIEKKNDSGLTYYYNNPSLCPGDAEFLYNIIRHYKPAKIIEIGCGFSTMMALKAEGKNKEIDKSKECRHICIEPYEMPWLEQLPVEVVRSKVEDLHISFFTQLRANDILFIDSSHVIRPQGDVLFEFLQIVPALQSGVIIHIHDIFSPRDYLKDWIIDQHCFWNEQYLLEAFLSYNNQFRILGAVNFLKTNYQQELGVKCPLSGSNSSEKPGSFWITRN